MAGSTVNLGSHITYLPFGPLNAMTYGNGKTLSATFDSDYYPTNRTVSGGIANWTYTTDANGNVTQAGPSTYGYDALNRVNAENPGTAASYTYDATDNRLTKVQGSTTTTTVPAASNKISAVGAASYAYDAAGNITNDGTNAYTWDAAGNLATVNTTAGVYTYNAYHQRAKKVAGSTTTYYIYGPGGMLLGEYTSAFALGREYVYLNGAPLAQVDAGSPETLTYLHTDHLGTPRYGTNTSGTQVWAWTNDAFGISTPTGSKTVNLRMPGQYYDSESGLFYNWNRYYNPNIGRYVSSDPIGIAGGLNTFGYVGQNPTNHTDYLGLVNPLEGACLEGLILNPVCDAGIAIDVATADELSAAVRPIKLALDSAQVGLEGLIARQMLNEPAGPPATPKPIQGEGCKVGDYQYTKTVSNHLNDVIGGGPRLARPFMNSPLTINEIMGELGIPDPQAPGATLYRVPGSLNGTQGTWQLSIDTRTNTILHLNFVGG